MATLIIPYACQIIDDRIGDWAKATFSLDFGWMLARPGRHAVAE